MKPADGAPTIVDFSMRWYSEVSKRFDLKCCYYCFMLIILIVQPGLFIWQRLPTEREKIQSFLLDEAIFLAKKGLVDNLRSTARDVADDLMTYLQVNEVPVLACAPCAKARGISEKVIGSTVQEWERLLN